MPKDEGKANDVLPTKSMEKTKTISKRNNEENNQDENEENNEDEEDDRKKENAGTESQETSNTENASEEDKEGLQKPSPSPSRSFRSAAEKALHAISKKVKAVSKESKLLNSTAKIRPPRLKGRRPVRTSTTKGAFKALNSVDKELNQVNQTAKKVDKKTKAMKKAMNATKPKKPPKPCTPKSCLIEGYRPLAYEMVQKMKAEEPQAWVPGMLYSKTVLKNLQSILPPECNETSCSKDKKDSCWQKEKALVIDFVKGTTVYDKNGTKVKSEMLFEKPEDESSVVFTIKGKLFQSKDAKDNCLMEVRVSAQACPPTSQKTGGRQQVRECDKCSRGYVLAEVDTALKEEKNGRKCKQWFAYADTVVRNAFNLFSSAEIAQRVDKCLDKGLDLGHELKSSTANTFSPKRVSVTQKSQNAVTSLFPGYTPKAYEMLQKLVNGTSGPDYSKFVMDKIKQKVLLPAWYAGPGQQATNRECWATNKTYTPLVIQLGNATIFDSKKNKVDPGTLVKKPTSESYVTLTVKGKIFQKPQPPCLMAQQQCSMKVRVSAQACPASKHKPTCSGGGGGQADGIAAEAHNNDNKRPCDKDDKKGGPTLGDTAEDHNKDDKDTKKEENGSKGQEKKKGKSYLECRVCHHGYTMTDVQTTLVEGKDTASCSSWFTYTDAVFRTAFSSIVSAENAGRVQKCEK